MFQKKNPVKAVVPTSTLVFSHENTKVFSVMTTTRNNRCFVAVENDLAMCQSGECKDMRSSFVYSGQSEKFTCKHSEKVKVSSQPLLTSHCTPNKIEEYTADVNIKSVLFGVMNENANLPHVVQVSETVFAVYGQPSASNPMGYVHVNKRRPVLFMYI